MREGEAEGAEPSAEGDRLGPEEELAKRKNWERKGARGARAADVAWSGAPRPGTGRCGSARGREVCADDSFPLIFRINDGTFFPSVYAVHIFQVIRILSYFVQNPTTNSLLRSCNHL